MSAGTSTSGPITAAKATFELIPKTPIATAIASPKLLPAAVKALRRALRDDELEAADHLPSVYCFSASIVPIEVWRPLARSQSM